MDSPIEPKGLFASIGNYQDFKVWLKGHKLQALALCAAAAITVTDEDDKKESDEILPTGR